MMTRHVTVATLAAAVVLTASVVRLPAAEKISERDVVQFRGERGQGVSQQTSLPVRWSDTENLAWRTELPGAGSSSPIVLGNRIFLTCYSGYGVDEANPGDPKDLVRHVVCLSRADGKILWQKAYPSDGNEPRYQGNGARHGYSTSTCTTDGERLYVFFGRHGVYCLSPEDGRELWHVNVGNENANWGSSNSPILFNDLLIVNASIESRSIVALDKKTGRQVWQIPGIRGSWNTPVLVDVPGGKTELVVSLPEKIQAFDPANGDKLWECKGIPDSGYVCPSVVTNGGIVYAIGGRRNTAMAVKAGGRGDVTDSHVLWTKGVGSNVVSPVYHDGHLYWVHEGRGTAYCINAETGETVYQERLQPRPGTVYASPLLADGKLYCVSQHNGTYVIAASPTFELLAVNQFASDEHRANACAVAHEGQLLIRSDKYLHCVGK